MSKPREFWIGKYNPFVSENKADVDHDENAVHVIEKSAADKLAEALEKVNKWRPNQFQDRELYEYGQQALKEYRGEK